MVKNKEWLDFKERMLLVIFIFLFGISQKLGVFGLSNKFIDNLLVMVLIVLWIISLIQSIIVTNQTKKKKNGKK